MVELILFSGYYLSPFVRFFLIGLFIWLLLRQFYNRNLYEGGYIHPYFTDICLLVSTISLSYLFMAEGFIK